MAQIRDIPGNPGRVATLHLGHGQGNMSKQREIPYSRYGKLQLALRPVL